MLAGAGIYISREANLPRGHDWLLDIERALAPRLPSVILDVGANVGQTSLALAARFPDSRIHAFEPVSATFAQLKANTALTPQITCHNLALSDRSGSAKVRVVPLSLVNSLQRGAAIGADQAAVEETLTLGTVDEFAARHGLAAIDILKTDTEGHDLAVLRGAAPLFAAHRIAAVYCEVTFSRENTLNTSFFEVFEHLSALGLRFLGLYEMFYFQTKPWNESFCNALFVDPQAAEP